MIIVPIAYHLYFVFAFTEIIIEIKCILVNHLCLRMYTCSVSIQFRDVFIHLKPRTCSPPEMNHLMLDFSKIILSPKVDITDFTLKSGYYRWSTDIIGSWHVIGKYMLKQYLLQPVWYMDVILSSHLYNRCESSQYDAQNN